MTLELESKPTTRRRSKLDELVENNANPNAEEAAIAEARARDDAVFDELSATEQAAVQAAEDEAFGEDTGEIVLTDEERAEFEARTRKFGLGGSLGDEPPTMLVTGYANGEAIDVEVERSARAQEAERTGTPEDTGRITITQAVMPGFEGQTAAKVQLGFTGQAVLDLNNAQHKALWDALKWQGYAEIGATVYVATKSFRSGADPTAHAALKVMAVRLAGGDEEDGDDYPACESCGREAEHVSADDVPLCQECFVSLAAELADDPPTETCTNCGQANDCFPEDSICNRCANTPVIDLLKEGTALDQALAEAALDESAE